MSVLQNNVCVSAMLSHLPSMATLSSWSSSLLSSSRFSNGHELPGRSSWKLRYKPSGCFVGSCFRNLGILGFREGFGLGRRRRSDEVFIGGRRSRSCSNKRDDVFFVKAVSANAGEDGNELLEISRRGSKPTKLLTLPTILTLCRVAAVPALLTVFYLSEEYAAVAGTTIFVAAALTDWLDGYLARKMGVISEFGAFLDPVADKLMVAAALVLLCTRPLAMPWARLHPWILPLPAIAIIGREITMSALREWAASQGGNLHKAVAVSSLGKLKTASQMVAITLLLATQDGRGGALGATGVALLYIAAGLALWSLAVYIKAIFGNLAT
ncbi:unnamed protein product [Sphagnum compactum]